MHAHPAGTSNLHLLSRNPIFNSTKNVWGYEIQTTAGIASDSTPAPEHSNVSAAIIAGDYIGLNTILARNKKMLLAYSWEQLLNQIPYAFPAQSSVVLVNNDCQQETSLIPVLRQLSDDGHTIALEWHQAVTPQAAFKDLATVICISTPDETDHAEFRRLLDAGKTCIVRNVTTKEQFEHLQALGIHLFQGRYFKTAEIIPGKKLSSHQNSRIQIMRIIESDSPDLDHLAQTVQSDVTLSYRLLTYLNSPTFGFRRKIDSIRQAITLLGWINVRNWLRAVLLTDIAQGEQQSELLHLTLTRARFLEQVLKRYDYWDFKPDEMFLLGMFSLLDAILGIPMQDALTFLPLNDAQKKALCADVTSEYMPLLAVASAFEDMDDPGALDKVLLDLSLDPETTRRLHYEAGAWATSILDAGRTA